MTGYRVTFFKNLVNSSGHCVKCPQATISVEHAKSIERALTAGKRRFERTKGIQDWAHALWVGPDTSNKDIHRLTTSLHQSVGSCQRSSRIRFQAWRQN